LNNNPPNGVPGWMIFLGSTLVALVVTGTVSILLILGRPVPQELWLTMAVIATAYFGGGPFLGVLTHNATTSHALLDTLNHGLAVLNQAVQTMTTGTPTAKNFASGGTVTGIEVRPIAGGD
jgi:hypothetical protein